MRFITLLLFFTFSLSAHPHIFVDVLVDVHVDKQNRVKNVFTWRFDPLVTQQFLMDFDMDSNGALNPDEVEELKAATFDTLAGHSYFTRMKLDKKKIALDELEAFEAFIKEGRLHYRYHFEKTHDLDHVKKVFISCYDPDFYISMVMEKSWVNLENEGKRTIQPIIKVAKSPNGFVYALELKVK